MPRDDREIAVSRPAKVFYPESGVTKGDVVEHFRLVAEVMVPHLRGRPLSLRRFPDGITDEGFFQKEVPDHFPDWIDVADIPRRREEKGTSHYVVCSDAASLVYLANQAVLEFHIWPSRVGALDKPDLMVIDIDPPDGKQVGELRSVARRARDVFLALGLEPFVQATGGRGFHVVAPLDPSTGYDTVRQLAREIADLLALLDSDRLTTAIRKDRRGNRIFLDTNRNGYAQTFIAPYSTRARPGAPVAVPLDWGELGKAEPNGWDLTRLRRRLARKTDPWADIYQHAVSAEAARDRLIELTAPRA
ncbi:MAG: non-homologous end-joining DNA ligase [Pseudonocardiaceae bacterium]